MVVGGAMGSHICELVWAQELNSSPADLISSAGDGMERAFVDHMAIIIMHCSFYLRG